MMPATISATLARASEAIGHTAAILDRLEARRSRALRRRSLSPWQSSPRLEAKAKARAERAEHLASIRAREDS